MDQLLANACVAHKAGRAPERNAIAAEAFELLARIDGLVNLRPDRRLETWVGAARSWARSADEAAYYDRNSRTLITIWGWRAPRRLRVARIQRADPRLLCGSLESVLRGPRRR